MTLDVGAEPEEMPADDASRLTVAELIRVEISGKSNAVARYDAIIWKIRTGYVLVIYGAITAVSALTGSDDEPLLTKGWVLPVVVVAFGLAAFMIDSAFSRSKFRVVAARNELLEHSWKFALGGFSSDAVHKQQERLIKLSRMSGEEEDPRTSAVVRGYLRSRERLLVSSRSTWCRWSLPPSWPPSQTCD